MTSICRSKDLPIYHVVPCVRVSKDIFMCAHTARLTHFSETHSVPRSGGSSNSYSANLSSFHLIKVSCQLPIQIPSQPPRSRSSQSINLNIQPEGFQRVCAKFRYGSWVGRDCATCSISGIRINFWTTRNQFSTP